MSGRTLVFISNTAFSHPKVFPPFAFVFWFTHVGVYRERLCLAVTAVVLNTAQLVHMQANHKNLFFKTLSFPKVALALVVLALQQPRKLVVGVKDFFQEVAAALARPPGAHGLQGGMGAAVGCRTHNK